MATGWAVASATILALSLAHVFLDIETPGVYPEGATRVAVHVLNVALYGAWAYGIAMAAHGNKGALAALLAYAILWGVGQAGATIALAPIMSLAGLIHALNLVLGILGSFAIWREIRARRGPVRWIDATILCVPLFLQIVLLATNAPGG